MSKITWSDTDNFKISVIINHIKKGHFSNQLLVSSNSADKLLEFGKLLAGCLVCDKNQWDNCECINHQKVDNDTYVDLKIIGDFTTSIKKEEIQAVIKEFSYSGLETKNIKIYIIAGAELLTEGAANSLLKFLEEPTVNTYAVLLTKAHHRVLPTIQSRCVSLQLSNVYVETEWKYLDSIEKFLDNTNTGHSEKNFILAQEWGIYNAQELQDLFAELVEYTQKHYLEIKNYNFILQNSFNAIQDLNQNINKSLVIENFLINVHGAA